MSKKPTVTVDELMSQLRQDPQYVERMRLRDEQIADNRDEFESLEAPVLRDLWAVGVNVATIGNARLLQQYMPFSPRITNVFLDWLPKAHPRLLECLVRLLAASEPFDGRPLADLFDRDGSSHLRWLIANAIAESRPLNITEWIEEKLRDPRVGSSKEMLLIAYARLGPACRAIELAKEQFQEFPIHAAIALSEVGGPEELRFLQERSVGMAEKNEIAKSIRKLLRRLAKD